MGKYINHTSSEKPLPALGKVKALVADGAKIVNSPLTWEEDLVCVANNGFFECAAYLYDQDELEAFTHPDGRPKTWLKYPHAKTLAK
jgi:hypothetical protein